MVGPKLSYSDLWMLLKTFRGQSPAIPPEALTRLQKRGFIDSVASAITESGRQYAVAFEGHIEELRKGIRIDTPHRSRVPEALASGPWYVSYPKNDRIFWNKEIVIRHDDFLPPNAISISEKKKPPWERLFRRWEKLARCGWGKAEAYAIQSDGTEHGPVCAVIRARPRWPNDNANGFGTIAYGMPTLDRVQLKYYDLIQELFPDAQWIRRSLTYTGTRQIAVKMKWGRGWNRKAIAFLCPLLTVNWPIPLYIAKEDRKPKPIPPKPKPKIIEIPEEDRERVSNILRAEKRQFQLDSEFIEDYGHLPPNHPAQFQRAVARYFGHDGVLSGGEFGE